MIKYLSTIKFGADPEFFFERKPLIGRKGTIIGAEKIIPKKGIYIGEAKIIIDGVQAELNPSPATCRESFGRGLHFSFQKVAEQMRMKRIKINWNACVKITRKEMNSLCDKSKMFGCSPSLNAYKEHIDLPNGAEYLFRSAGGHIHLGAYYPYGDDTVHTLLHGDVDDVVKILDIIVGNTCVLIDRDEGEIERRKCYGRAGEYRKPKYGIEYRVLSNFWLHNYQTMSFVLGLVRLGLGFAESKIAKRKLFNTVNEKEIRDAINNNDFELAQYNFNLIKPLIEKYATNDHSLNKYRIPIFEHFVLTGGLKKWFKEDPMKHWTSENFEAVGTGWERFLEDKVAPDYQKSLN